ncbi:MAG: phenylalanine--tRNA ligase subunit beta [Rhodospirillales bacterium]|nr:phenylalanine--tRNA ligase subunit beta [Rhodospirillales bacterium]
MKFTLNWLKEHLDTTASLDDILNTLTNIGLEVEEVENRAAKYAAFKSAHVVRAEKHPDADRLKVCMVDTGTETVQVVCGAPNARAGMKAIFAPAGTYIPGTDVMLKKGVIRGQDSNGMLVSEREMGISDEHTGIIDLPSETAIGVPFADLYGLNDIVIDISLTPNRADCAGIYGIARDLAAAGLGTLKPIPRTDVQGQNACPVGVHLDFTPDTAAACPHFAGRLITGVRNGPSPAWLQQKLKAIGLRPISTLVDITNYMTITYNRPLHVYDADRLQGDIAVRLSHGGETLAALNDKTYTLDAGMTMICDDSGVLGLGGIVGGTSTGVEFETVNVFIEAAYFDPMRTARTGRTLQISSDARYRFERGIDPDFTKDGLDIATRMILDLCGGTPSERVETGAAPQIGARIDLPVSLVKKRIGLEIPVQKQKDILESLGFTIDAQGKETLTVTAPSWRGDIEQPVCLVEEISRIYGFEHIEAVSVTRAPKDPRGSEPRTRTLARQARTSLISRGMNECVTWSFMAQDLATLFGANDNNSAPLLLSNPISADLNRMRPSILGNLLSAASENARKGFTNNAFFEVGPVFRNAKVDGQDFVCTLIRTGAKGDKHWSSTEASAAVDLFDLKADVQAVLSACGAPETLQITRDAPEWYHPGQSACLRLGKNVLATFGALHPAVLEEMDVDFPAVGAEIYLENIPAARVKQSTEKPLLTLSPFQPVVRDFAFLLDEGIEADTIIRAAKSAEKQMVDSVHIFDVYQGKGIEAGKKSVALSVIFQPQDHTLTDSEIEGLSQKIITAIQQKTGGLLRA